MSSQIGPPPGSTVNTKRRKRQHCRSVLIVSAATASHAPEGANRHRKPSASGVRSSACASRPGKSVPRRAVLSAGVSSHTIGNALMTALLLTRGTLHPCGTFSIDAMDSRCVFHTPFSPLRLTDAAYPAMTRTSRSSKVIAPLAAEPLPPLVIFLPTPLDLPVSGTCTFLSSHIAQGGKAMERP